MSPFAALALYPLWALALAVGFTALRMSRRLSAGLVLLCLAMAVWVTGLILLESPGCEGWAERVLPGGMLLAGAFVQTGAELAGGNHRRVVALAWIGSIAVTALGLAAPQLIYGSGAVGAGPLFLPLAAISVVGTLAATLWLWRLARAASGSERRRRYAVLAANIFGALGGGGSMALHITGVGPVAVAAPFLFVSILMAASAVWRGEDPRGRDLLAQGLTLAVLTALLSAPGLALFFAALPKLVPGGAVLSLWGLLVVFLAALPLDPLRLVIADWTLARVFARPAAVRTLDRQLEQQEVRAEHAERLAELGQLAGAVAHEVRNPLGVILAEVKLLETERANEESLAAIRAQVQRASRFLDELLRYAVPRPLSLREIDLTESLQAALGAVARIHGARERIVFTGGPLRLEADPDAIGDVATNLIANAVIATEATQAQVRVRLEDAGAAVRIVVEDDGPGVPRELLARLFEPFVTGRGRDAKHPGTGLGLALSKRLAERHGARITHERPAQGGARFTVLWPKLPAA